MQLLREKLNQKKWKTEQYTFAFGDGFSNVFYPTNPALLISLGLADVSYNKWFRWSFKFQLINLFLTCGILLLGFVVGY